MRIMLLAQHFAPESVSGAVLATELAVDLAQRGNDISFVTCAPSYPTNVVFAGYKNRILAKEIISGVQVVRTWSYISPRSDFWRRLLNYGTFSATAFYGGLAAGKPDIIFSYSPPLPLGVSAYLLSRWWRVPWILRVEDLYPDAAVAAGVLRNPTAIRLFRALERFLYGGATHISLISEGFRRYLLEKEVSPEKLSVTPVWTDPSNVRPLVKENAFRHEHKLDNLFVVMYAGALGHTSALEDVLVTAGLLQDETGICFVIVGEGVKKAQLQAYAHAHKLRNVRFLPFQPRDRFAEMLAAADVSLVTLNRRSSSFSLPNKIFNIMASGRPILAVTPEESEVADLVRETACGVIVAPEQHEQLRIAIIELTRSSERLAVMGRNGRQALASRFDRATCVAQFAEIIGRVAA